MTRILLTTTALVAFAGAAAAEVTFGGDAKFGYNDEVENGVYYSFGAKIKGSMELDNGLTASMSGDVNFDNDGTATTSTTFGDSELNVDDLVVSLASGNASLTFGDTAPAADAMWSGAGNMENDGFADKDDYSDAGIDAVLISKMKAAGAEIAISYAIDDSNASTNATDADDLAQLQLGVKGTAGSISYGFAYQDDTGFNEIMAAYVGTTFGGADVKLAYADADNAGTSIGISATYKVGDAVKVKVFYVSEDPETGSTDDNMGLEVAYAAGPLSVDALYHDGTDEDMQINFAYDMGNGLNLFGGYRDEGSASNDTYTYVGADYDLGGGANLRVSYAEADSAVGTARDELGKSEDVLEGTTVEVSFKF